MNDYSELAEAVGRLDEVVALAIVGDISADPNADVEAAVRACQGGLEIVGEQYALGEYYVADLIFAGALMAQVLEILKPRIGQNGERKLGKMVLCTVQGDVHDIGKNIVKYMMEAGGLEVIDLGIDAHPDAIIRSLRETKARILGLSGVLSLAMDSMRCTVDALEAAGLRQSVKIIIGGVPVTSETCGLVGADAWNYNVVQSVKICRDWASHDG